MVLELVVLTAVGMILRRFWRRSDHSLQTASVLLCGAGFLVTFFGGVVATPVPPMMFVAVGLESVMVVTATVLSLVQCVVDRIRDRRGARRSLLMGYPPKPSPIGGGWAFVLGLLDASASIAAAFTAMFFVTWAVAVTSLAAGGPGEFQGVPTQTSIEIAAAAVALGLLVGFGAWLAGQRELRRWEDLTAGIEYRVRIAVKIATAAASDERETVRY
ncbi:hypothetical protein [Clavibacter californiensis]|uniref:hypothetical protein n=1 Tax=Clavibacter californiensis TaxID=1401995 RepID=UPI0011C23AA1|nr:hypothetical protein [Clavibacter californiensis]